MSAERSTPEEPPSLPASPRPSRGGSAPNTAFRKVALLRGLVWASVAGAVHWLFAAEAAPATLAAAFASAVGLLGAAVPFPHSVFSVRLVDLLVDFLAAAVVVGATGGSLSPFAPLLFLTTLEAQALLGLPGGIAAAAASAGAIIGTTGVSRSLEVIAGAVLFVSLLVETALLHRLDIHRPSRDTLMPVRTVEDLEMLVEAVEEQNRQLREKHRELTSTVRRSQGSAEEASVRYRLLSASLEDADVVSAYRGILDVLKDAFDADSGAIWALDYRGEALEVRTVSGAVSPVVADEPIPLGREARASDVRRACERQLRLAVPQAVDARPEGADGIVDAGPSRPDVISSALRAGEKIVGAVALAGAKEGRFQEGDPARLNGLSVAAGIAVRNVEQTTSLQRGIREISILHEMNLLVQNTTELDQIYEQIVELASKIVRFENCTLFRYQVDRKQLAAVATRGRPINLMEHLPFEHGQGISAWVAGNRKPLFIADLTREPGLLNAELMPPRVRSFISVPMAVRDHLIGVINVSHSQANAFTQEEARVLNLLAGQAAITIEREEMVRELGQLAITDGLTGIYNHRYFQLRLDNEVKRGLRYRIPFSLLMIDLDHFKSINDRYGHGAGDQVLAEVAATLKGSVRETDIASRYGGEEFAIILTQTGLSDAMLTAERLRKAVAERIFEAPDGTSFRATVSIGVAAFPDHAESREGLLQASDRALYAAKHGGRNRVMGA